MATDLGLTLTEHLRILFDTAALVLIWLVQLVIYPAFRHFRSAEFRAWHPHYTRQVSYVVMPVMLGQLALYGWCFITHPGGEVVINFILILVIWGITFLRAVPLHGALDRAEDHLPLSAALLRVNGWRTLLWTAVWVVTLIASVGK